MNSFVTPNHSNEQQAEDCFVDATDDLTLADQSTTKSSLAKVNSITDDNGAATGSNELRARLEETTVILRMALNNEFVRALEICGQR